MRTVLPLLALLLCAVALPAGADTGTYVIEQYDATLAPHADGKVDLDYHQKWRVTGGHIPWITVGVPNSDFEITKSGLAAKSIGPQNQGSWSGVRIDLDRDYQPGQSFEISFSITQNKLFYADAENYRLDFTPGWYDNAPVEALTLRLKYFVKPDSITADPAPTAKTEEQLEWSGIRLGDGEKYTIHVSFPKTATAQAIPEEGLRQAGRGGGVTVPDGGEGPSEGGGWAFWPLLVLFGVIGLLILYFFSWVARNVSPYTGGSVFWGSIFGPGSGGDDSGGAGGGGGRETGGGGGFGGGGFSCACACVSCACACACAGGGGAGCSRKLQHHCPQCEKLARGEEDAA